MKYSMKFKHFLPRELAHTHACMNILKIYLSNQTSRTYLKTVWWSKDSTIDTFIYYVIGFRLARKGRKQSWSTQIICLNWREVCGSIDVVDYVSNYGLLTSDGSTLILYIYIYIYVLLLNFCSGLLLFYFYYLLFSLKMVKDCGTRIFLKDYYLLFFNALIRLILWHIYYFVFNKFIENIHIIPFKQEQGLISSYLLEEVGLEMWMTFILK